MRNRCEYYGDLDREYNGSLLEMEGDKQTNLAFHPFDRYPNLSVLSNDWQTIDLVESVVLP